MKPTTEIDGWLNPSVALVLLESLRDVDTPAEVLEDEAVADSYGWELAATPVRLRVPEKRGAGAGCSMPSS